MGANDEFHKRLERIQETHATGQTVMRRTPAGIRGQKIGLVPEKENTKPKRRRAIAIRLLIMLVIGVFGVRLVLAQMINLSPEDLDARQAELWSKEDYKSKAQGAALMAMGVADPLIAKILPTGQSYFPEENADLAQDGNGANAAEVEPVAEDTTIEATPAVPLGLQYPMVADKLVLGTLAPSEPVVAPSAPRLGFLDKLKAATQTGAGAPLEKVLPPNPPSGWQMVREADILNGAVGYKTMKSAWDASQMPVAWGAMPFMGAFVTAVEENKAALGSKDRYLRLYFNPSGQAALVEFLVLSPNAAAQGEDALIASGGDEIFVEEGEQSFWFKSTANYEEGAAQQFEALLGDRILVGARVMNASGVELRDLLRKLPLSQIAATEF